MNKYLMLLMLTGLSFKLDAQQQLKTKFISFSVMNTHTALPFGKFTGIFYKAFHPGIEISYGKNFAVKNKHDWYYDFRLACFYHRFVQYGIPVYSNLGYRYKFNQHWSAFTEAGVGYLHSIPATAKLRLNEAGDYENNKGPGRMQANACFALGAGYQLQGASANSLNLFISYQQRLQFPFVKSYVPLLPYNSFLLGLSRPLTRKNK